MSSRRLIATTLLCAFAFAANAQEPAAPIAGAPEEASPSADERQAPLHTAPSTSADEQTGTLELPAPREAPGAAIRMPEKGMTMKEVEARFGPPSNRLPAVGKPPITRWIYPDYTVYFEYSVVIHSVVNERPSNP